MIQLGNGERFSAKLFAGILVGERTRRQNRKGHVPFKTSVMREIYRALSAFTQFFNDLVVAQGFQSHGGSPISSGGMLGRAPHQVNCVTVSGLV